VAAVATHHFLLGTRVLNQDFGLLQRREYFPVQHLISELAIEALVISVLPRAAGLNEQFLDSNMPQPLSHNPVCELYPLSERT